MFEADLDDSKVATGRPYEYLSCVVHIAAGSQRRVNLYHPDPTFKPRCFERFEISVFTMTDPRSQDMGNNKRKSLPQVDAMLVQSLIVLSVSVNWRAVRF